jgi:hypothetical protein
MNLDNFGDVPKESSTSFFHSHLFSRFTEWLAREATDQNIMRWNFHNLFVGRQSNVAVWLEPPVALVNASRVLVYLRRINALSTHSAKSSVKATNASEEIYELESHRRTLNPATDKGASSGKATRGRSAAKCLILGLK